MGTTKGGIATGASAPGTGRGVGPGWDTGADGAVLVSGAGSGIGRAMAREFASRGATVVLVGRRREALEETREGLAEPSRHVVIEADVRDPAALRRGFLAARLDSLDVRAVVANAGKGGENRYGEGDAWKEIVSTNLDGTYVFVNEALPALRASRAPVKHVLVTASILARIGVPGYAAYCASKAGLLGLVRAWAAEFAHEGILVNALCPGWVDTAMARSGIEAFAKATGTGYDQALRGAMERVPMGRMASPEEIAAFAAFLVSPLQSSMTGQGLDVNNGAWMG